jgi:hypothetical protein
LPWAAALAASLSAGSAVAAPPAAAMRSTIDADHVADALAPRHRTFGLSMDVGVPDGAALGLSVRPKVDWLRLGASFTYNGMGPGFRGSLTLDPIRYPIAPTFTVEGGHAFPGQVPGVSNSPALTYNYANLHLGLEVGNRETFRFFLRGGVSWLDLGTSNFQAMSGMSGLGDPSYKGWLAPSGKLGFATYF